MESQLSDEEFERLQNQLIKLKTSNYELEEQCKKLKIEKQRLEDKVDVLEGEYQKLQKTINRSKKAKDIELLLNENKNLQKKLEDQEDEFRLQNKTLLEELATLVAANEKLEEELNALKQQGGADPEQEVTALAKQRMVAEQQLGKLRDNIHRFSSSDGRYVPHDSGGLFVQVEESDEGFEKTIASITNLVKNTEQILHNVEVHEMDFAETLARVELQQEDRKKVEMELKQVKEKLRRKQESLMQLQEEKEKLYEKNQRLQVQLNNAQSAMQDIKEKTSHKVQELESQILVLSGKSVKLLKSLQETDVVRLQEKLTQLQALTDEREIAQLNMDLEESRALAEKRLSLIDEMSLRLKQKSDDYKQQVSNLTNKFSKRERELKEEVEALQEEVEKLAPLQSQLDIAVARVTSLEEMCRWFEKQQNEVEEVKKSIRADYNHALEHLKAEHGQELLRVKLGCENREKILEEELATVKSESEKKSEALNKLEQQLHDAKEEKKLAEKKGAAVMKDLRRQLAGERKRAEKLQERLRDVLSEGSHSKSDVSKMNDPETSSISSWSLMSGNCETRDASTRENSIIAGSVGNLNGNASPPPEEQDLEQENHQLLSRVLALQQEKWVLEEKINHLEQGSSAMAEDLMRKTALIQFYCMEGRSDPVATSTSSPSTDRLSMKKFVEMLKGDEHVHESNRRMQRMLEETLTKNMHLQSDLEQLSREVARLSIKHPDT
ncbi:GRIP1-associated protein 1 [Blattella germanica]|nr:GRIP1-associated protein 1 [Blattella germanica]